MYVTVYTDESLAALPIPSVVVHADPTPATIRAFPLDRYTFLSTHPSCSPTITYDPSGETAASDGPLNDAADPIPATVAAVPLPASSTLEEITPLETPKVQTL